MASFGSISANSLFRRCVNGCPNETPACPACAEDEICSLVYPTCTECQKTICVASAAAPSTISSTSGSSDSGPNVSGIAGGVVGGVLAIAALTYLVWKFCIKNKRQQYRQGDWTEDHEDTLAPEKDFTMRRDARASTHTVASIASTVLTRASNIIQIAYIPGVTNRSAPSTPGLLVPPVPPIPIALSSASSTPNYDQEHFFMPGNLRDSTYSGISERSDRTSYARTSVASTIYGRNAVVSPVPAQTVIRGKAAVVSVRSNGHSPGESTPPVPNVDYGKYTARGPPSPAFSVGSTFLNSASAATQVRPTVVRVASAQTKASISSSVTDEDAAQHGSMLIRNSNAITIIDDTPSLEQGPFGDPPQRRQPSSGSLSAVTEEAAKKKKSTPFGDENELK